MPIYLYQCDSCGVRFEKFQRMSAEPLTDCPECDGDVRRIIQPVGIIFKGSGFYVTDNRSGSSPTLGGKKESKSGTEKSDEKEESSAGESKAEKSSSTESKAKKEKAD